MVILDITLSIQPVRRVKITRNLFPVMHICSAVLLRYLDAGFETQRQKDFLCTCLLLLLLLLLLATCCCCKKVLLTLDPKKDCKTSTGNPSSVI